MQSEQRDMSIQSGCLIFEKGPYRVCRLSVNGEFLLLEILLRVLVTVDIRVTGGLTLNESFILPHFAHRCDGGEPGWNTQR